MTAAITLDAAERYDWQDEADDYQDGGAFIGIMWACLGSLPAWIGIGIGLWRMM